MSRARGVDRGLYVRGFPSGLRTRLQLNILLKAEPLLIHLRGCLHPYIPAAPYLLHRAGDVLLAPGPPEDRPILIAVLLEPGEHIAVCPPLQTPAGGAC